MMIAARPDREGRQVLESSATMPARSPFGIGIQLNSLGVEALRRQARNADRAGFAFASVGDNPAQLRDTFVSLAEIAHGTETCFVGTSILTPHHRDPLVVASAMSSVAEIAPGRVFLGLGTGRARRPARVEELRDHVRVLRALWSGEITSFRGESLRLTWDAAPVPIVICGSGQRVLEAAGELADAVIIETGLSQPQIDRATGWIQDGARRAGRDIADLQLWWYARTSIADNYERALEESLLSMTAAGAFLARSPSGLADVPARFRTAMARLGQLYDMSAHLRTDPGNPNRRLITDDDLLAYLIDRMGVVGAPTDWLARIQILRERGVQNLICIGASGDRDVMIDLVGRAVIPGIR